MRYRSKYKELKIPMQRAYKTLVNGQTVVTPGTRIEFEDYIYETEEPAIIEFLDNDPTCVKMQSNSIFAKIADETLAAATKQETLEEREARIQQEMDEIKKEKKKVSPKEKGKTKKVGSKKEEPAY